MKNILKMNKIVKSFYGVEVLHGVDLELYSGEVLALIGENGAGKSTMMKILMGIEQPDSGSIELFGKETEISSPSKALHSGVAMIHQELHPILDMTVAENMYIGREVRKFGVVNMKLQEKMTSEQLDKMELNISPSMRMGDLSVSEIQMVEIAKAVSYGSKILIMDEPTSAITEEEVHQLFKIIEKLKNAGIGIIYISHKLDELPIIADRVQILRDGNFVHAQIMEEITRQDMIKYMVGREITEVYPKCDNEITDVVLEVKNLTRKGEFNNISFCLHRGEKLGIAGLVGAGRTELVTTIFGDRHIHSGEIYLNGERLKLRHPIDAIRKKIALVTEDRKLFGLNLLASVKDNIMMCIDKRESTLGFLNNRRANELSDIMIDKFHIKVTSRDQVVSNLSGGNQQKVVLGKWLLTEPDIIIFDEPTRGIDVGAKAEIYNLINNLVMQGKSVIIISSEMPELISLSDRIIVMSEGELMGELFSKEATQEMVMSLAAHNSKIRHKQHNNEQIIDGGGNE